MPLHDSDLARHACSTPNALRRVAMAFAGLLLATSLQAAAPATWSAFPYQIAPGNAGLTLPAADGQTVNNESDTWYFQIFLQGVLSGRKYAANTIFDRNHIGATAANSGAGLFRADFYMFSLYDIDNKSYATFSEFDYPPANLIFPAKLNASSSNLNLTFQTQVGTVTWNNATTAQGTLVPFVQNVNLVGTDQNGQAMRLVGTLSFPTRAPYPQGGTVLNGVITCYGQPNTLEYGQAEGVFNGTMTLAGVSEQVVGHSGHYDRQIFPKYVGTDAGFLGRGRSHQWPSPTLDDGTELSIWLQYLRGDTANTVVADSGVTVNTPGVGQTPTSYASDITDEVYSYVRFPFNLLPSLPIPAAGNAMYMPARHRLVSKTLGMDLMVNPIVANPGHVLPVPYSTGPADYTGTFNGKPVHGQGFNETDLGLYRNWELIKVLRDSVQHLPGADFTRSGTSAQQIISTLDTMQSDITAGNYWGASFLLGGTLQPMLQKIKGPDGAYMLQIYADLAVTIF